MEITFLGTKSVSVYEANSLGILIRAKDTSLLLECGPFIPLQLTQNNFKIEAIPQRIIQTEMISQGKASEIAATLDSKLKVGLQ